MSIKDALNALATVSILLDKTERLTLHVPRRYAIR